jgi:aminoglycoside phosphotransferase (APT) family kinase protein
MIAKGGAADRVTYETYIVGTVLPGIGVAGPRMLGHVTDDDGTPWLLLEDVGDATFRYPSPQTAYDFGRAVAHMHIEGRRLAADPRLLDRSPSWYRRLTETTQVRLRGYATKSFQSEEPSPMASAFACLGRVLDAWPAIESRLSESPPTFTHGDLAFKHVREAARLVLIDWAEASWSLPAVDCFGFGSGGEAGLPAYRDALRQQHHIDEQTIEDAVSMGRIIRSIRSIDWDSSLGPERTSYKRLDRIARSVAQLNSELERLSR